MLSLYILEKCRIDKICNFKRTNSLEAAQDRKNGHSRLDLPIFPTMFPLFITTILCITDNYLIEART